MADANAKEISLEFVRQSELLLDLSVAKIRHCLAQLSVDQVWWRPSESMNSIGNLILHLAGNLRQWGVAPITGAKDLRDRPSEFAAREKLQPVALSKLLSQTVVDAKIAWTQCSPRKLMKKTTIQGFGVTFMEAIVHTSSHFVGHTHQIILVARLQLGDAYQFEWTPEADRGGEFSI